jgi:RND family efflux transporter MFP subunit
MTRLRVFAVVGVVVLILGGALIAATIPRIRQHIALGEASGRVADELPRVTVATARRAPETSELVLPGDAQGFRDSSLYARTNGYIKRWLVDIGDQVKEGQLLAEISAPDVDDQLAQARANLLLAKANLLVSDANMELAKITLDRDLKANTATSQQTVDQDRALMKTTAAQVESAKASIKVNEATVRQYEVLQSFQKIVAPFSGMITSRNVELGVLVTADNPSETRPIFHMTQSNPLRVFVNVPQVNSTAIQVGQKAIVFREEDPSKQYAGIVTRTANALDSNTRTLLTQIDVPNPKDALRPGMYLQVKFVIPRDTPSVLVPSAALVWRQDGTVIPVMDREKRVHYRKVQTGRDFGTEIEVISGLEGGETVIVHPGDALPEGQQVEPTPNTNGSGDSHAQPAK